MRSRLPGLLNAITATMLVIGIGTLVVSPLVYFALIFAEGFFESLGVIARGWGSSHAAVLIWIAVAVLAGPVLWAAWHYFRSALRAEDEMRGGDAPPAV